MLSEVFVNARVCQEKSRLLSIVSIARVRIEGTGAGLGGTGGGLRKEARGERFPLRHLCTVRQRPDSHGYKFKKKTFPRLIQTGEGFFLNLHLAKFCVPDKSWGPQGAAQRGN